MLLWILLVLAQDGACTPTARVDALRRSADALDVARLVAAVEREPAGACRDLVRAYLEGLRAAEAAYAKGGSPESLAPVRAAIARLRDGAAGRPRWAGVAATVLEAAAAAAQSEREEMAIHLAEASEREAEMLARGEGPVPLVAAQEAAGDLWLRVHRFDDARTAYEAAASRVGRTPRVQLGLARVAARTADPAACRLYAQVVTLDPGGRGAPLPAWLTEARAYGARPACRAAAGR